MRSNKRRLSLSLRTHMRALLLALFLLILLLEVHAVTKTWAGIPGATDQRWTTSTNWSPVGVPAAGDDVIIAQVQSSVSSGMYDIIDIPATAGAQCKSLNMSSDSRLQINSTTLSVAGQMTLAGQVCHIMSVTKSKQILRSDFVGGHECRKFNGTKSPP